MSPAASTVREAGVHEGACFSPAEAEPRGDDGGGGLEAPAARPSWFGRTRATFRNSVWAPVAAKLVGLVLAMIALSSVGIASMVSGANGVQVPLASMLGADINSAWLADKPAAAPHPSSSQSALAPQTASTPALAAVTNDTASSHVEGAAGGPSAALEGPPPSASAGMTGDGRVILNLANLEDLRHLPGVGAKRAEAILALRTRLGRFKQVNDLLRVKGIGVRGLKRIMPHVVLDAPKPAA